MSFPEKLISFLLFQVEYSKHPNLSGTGVKESGMLSFCFGDFFFLLICLRKNGKCNNKWGIIRKEGVGWYSVSHHTLSMVHAVRLVVDLLEATLSVSVLWSGYQYLHQLLTSILKIWICHIRLVSRKQVSQRWELSQNVGVVRQQLTSSTEALLVYNYKGMLLSGPRATIMTVLPFPSYYSHLVASCKLDTTPTANCLSSNGSAGFVLHVHCAKIYNICKVCVAQRLDLCVKKKKKLQESLCPECSSAGYLATWKQALSRELFLSMEQKTFN